MCSIDIVPCNQAHRHLRQVLRDAEMVVMDEINDKDDDSDDNEYQPYDRPRDPFMGSGRY